MKILHCPEIVGGNAQQLAKAERVAGLDSKAIAFRQNYFKYEIDAVLLPCGGGKIRLELARWRLLLIALSYDVIHYNFGQSIFPTYRNFGKSNWITRIFSSAYSYLFDAFDLKLFRFMGKGIVVTYQGDDARQGDYCRSHFLVTFANEVDANYYCIETDSIKRRRIEKLAKYADLNFSLNPDLLWVLPMKSTFLPYAHVDLQKWLPVKVANDKPIIMHAPTHREVKGTRFLLDAVSRLKEEGVPFELVLIEGMSHQDARKHYERADLLVDQLLAGWYGGVAVELMALGKPVIAYIRDKDMGFVPAEMVADLPVINANPESIYEILKYWLTDGRLGLRELGLRSRHYVERWHDPLKIAMQMKNEYENILKIKTK